MMEWAKFMTESKVDGRDWVCLSLSYLSFKVLCQGDGIWLSGKTLLLKARGGELNSHCK